jgi:hypothetical protein
MIELPAMAEPLGPLGADLSRDLADGDSMFTVAGVRAWVTGDRGRGVDHVVMAPALVAAGPRLAGARCEAATVTPLGVERRLILGDGVVVERIVVHRDSPCVVIEWHAPEQPALLALEWGVPARPGDPSGVAPLHRRLPRGAAVRLAGHRLVAFGFSSVPEHLGSSPDRFHARVAVTAGGSVRMAVAAAGSAADLERALRAAGRGRALVQGRRGGAEQLRADRLTVTTPDPALDRSLEWVGIDLAARVAETPGVGRSILSGREPARAAYVTADAVRAALDALTIGDFASARDVLGFLGRHQLESGAVPTACDLNGAIGPGTPAATLLYLLLASRFLDAVGDLAFLQGEWPSVRRAWKLARDAGPGGESGELRAAAIEGIPRAAAALGDAEVAAEAEDRRHQVGTGARRVVDLHRPDSHDPRGVVPRVRELLGVEPDATRGRLVLRPRPPKGWTRFQARSLAMGEARFTLSYGSEGRVHRFGVTQDRGAAPARLILAPELDGNLVAAWVDGERADLAPVKRGDRTGVPVQLALDHERTLELEMAEGGQRETPVS